ncbi:MAG: hypothetical protein WD358_08700 [Nitriliruptoraceae bacterium]
MTKRPVASTANGQRPVAPPALPTLDTGEPVLHRWFVLAMLALAPVAVAVTLWALASIPDGHIPPAERRPPGDASVTIDRGDADVPQTREEEAGPGCAEAITLIGDAGARAAARRALGATCQLLASGRFPQAEAGLGDWAAADGALRLATFELSGVESSARVADGRIIVELNAKFAFEDATRAAPALIHQLVLIADDGWPGRTVAADSELAAAQAQAAACARLSFAGSPPRGCADVEELLTSDDPYQAIVDAGFFPY